MKASQKNYHKVKTDALHIVEKLSQVYIYIYTAIVVITPNHSITHSLSLSTKQCKRHEITGMSEVSSIVLKCPDRDFSLPPPLSAAVTATL